MISLFTRETIFLKHWTVYPLVSSVHAIQDHFFHSPLATRTVLV